MLRANIPSRMIIGVGLIGIEPIALHNADNVNTEIIYRQWWLFVIKQILENRVDGVHINGLGIVKVEVH